MAGALTQSRTKQTAGVDTDNLAYSAAVAAGSFLAIGMGCWDIGGGAKPTVSDSVNGTWPAGNVFAQGLGGSAGGTVLAYFANSAAGTPTITVTFADPGDLSWVIAEFSGIATSSPVDGTPTTSTTASTTTPTSTAVTTSNTSMLLSVMTYDGGATTITPGTGWSQVAEDESTSFQPFSLIYFPAQTSGSKTSTWTLGAARVADIVMSAFTEASASITAAQMMPAIGQFANTGGMIGRVYK